MNDPLLWNFGCASDERADAQRKGCIKVGVVGFGTSTSGVIAYLTSSGIAMRLVIRQRTPIRVAPENAELRCGEDYLEGIDETLLILSPSVRRDTPQIADAVRRGVSVTTDVDLFFARVRGKVFGITGSDGKSTTCTIVARLLEGGGCFSRVVACGNIGRAASPYLCEDDERCGYAMELSSFQLMDVAPVTHRAVITNLTPNHLDWHRDMAEYAEAKRHLLLHCREPVLPLDLPALSPLYRGISPFAVFSAREDARTLARSGAELAVGIRDGWITKNGERFLAIARIRLGGAHNLYNYMAAIALTHGFCDRTDADAVAQSFLGMPHRARTIGRVDGVDCIDSSIDSSPSRTAMTLAAMDRRVILLIGGRGKAVPYDPLIAPIAAHAEAVVTSGENGDEIFRLLKDAPAIQAAGVRLWAERTLGDAIRRAQSIARPGGVILLSPAATSFDGFRNFEERGAFFRKVLGL